MNDEPVDKLKTLIENREQRSKIIGGEVFAMWGALNITAFLINYFIADNLLIWTCMIAIGIIAQIFYVRNFKEKEGHYLFWSMHINTLWIMMLILLPIIYYFFPFILKIYGPQAIFPLIFLWLSLGMFISGLFVEQKSMFFGSAAFFLFSILLALFIEQLLFIYPAGITFGLIIPGLWSRYEEKS